MLPSLIVKMMFPLHWLHFPNNGGRLNFVLQLTHLNSCCENFLRFPFMSLMKCFSITSCATSASSTALIFCAMSICDSSFSCIEGNVLYELHRTPALKFVVSCVNPMPSYCVGFDISCFIVFIFISQGILYSSAASYISRGYL